MSVMRSSKRAGVDRASERDRLKALFAEHFGYAMDRALPPLANLLIAARDLFDSDLDAFLIFNIIATRTFQDSRNAGVSLDQLSSGEVSAFKSLHTNVRSISESTGIPRETVRRKVHALIARGWVVREGDNLAVATAVDDLAPIREAGVEVVAIHHALGAELLRKVG